ncbi:MAG: hypothetical protein GTO67_08695, partial [Gammaproteobacteria bacterium]|nr:hypothetical protein [Gammaproteobacteria bacterium]NIM72135.1 hypothetical protein [Gammaproteobacteria bacterium]NIN38732.1 hypothetical protein [Gammaproteobacteria bacterium]NIO23877.1 hypothetical protein [Gammaproteobacteria bacterium]NIO64520.1 hypothetical protein [Gammaproteobacteria bacterium]
MTSTPDLIATFAPLILGALVVLIALLAWLLWRQRTLVGQVTEDRIRARTL